MIRLKPFHLATRLGQLACLCAAVPAFAQVPADQVSSALAKPAEARLAPPQAAASVTAGEGGPLADPTYTDDPVLAAAIKRYIANTSAASFDRVWTGFPMASHPLSELAKSDPAAVARQLDRMVWGRDLTSHVASLNWNGNPESIPLGTLSIGLTAPDGRSIQFTPFAPTTLASEQPTMNLGGADFWAGKSLQYELRGATIVIHSTYVIDGGLIMDAPDVIIPASGGTQTVALTGGGSATLTLEDNPYLTKEQIIAWTK